MYVNKKSAPLWRGQAVGSCSGFQGCGRQAALSLEPPEASLPEIPTPRPGTREQRGDHSRGEGGEVLICLRQFARTHRQSVNCEPSPHFSSWGFDLVKQFNLAYLALSCCCFPRVIADRLKMCEMYVITSLRTFCTFL